MSGNAIQWVIYIATFVWVGTLTLVGLALFSKGWQSYEQQYIEGEKRSFDFLTLPPQHLLYLRIVGLFAGLFAGYVMTDSLFVGALGGMVGFLSPQLFVRWLKRRRFQRFAEQLTDALSTLNNALRSGYSLPKAFQLIASDMSPPISQEFSILVQELRLGAGTEEGLRHMHDRVPSEDLDLLITSIGISQSVGGNLTEVFDKIARMIRERRRIEGRIDALTAQGKLQGLVVGLLPLGLAFMINLIDPDLLEPLYTTPEGYLIIGVMIVFELLGFYFIRRICTIEV